MRVEFKKIEKGAMLAPLSNEKGVALVLAIGMMLVLTILGMVVLTATDRGLKASGSYKDEQVALLAAERALEYSLNRDLIVKMPSGGSVDLMTDQDENSVFHKDTINAGGLGSLESGSMTDIGPGELPVRLAEKYGTDFGANYYDISVEAKGQGNSRARIESQMVRLYKLDDDSIFMTKGNEP